MKKFVLILFINWILAISICLGQMDTILIDLGNANPSILPWNNLVNQSNGMISDLTNSNGFFTGIAVLVDDDFTGTNVDGTTNPSASINLPATATSDSFFGNTADFNGAINPTADIN